MTRLAVLGATGRMGRAVLDVVLRSQDLQLVAAMGRAGSAALGTDAGTLVGQRPCGVAVAAPADADLASADVVIDFSLPEALESALPFLGNAALVSGTTGLSAALSAQVAAHAQRAPVLQAANFSTGVHVLHHLVALAARALPDFDIEVVEAHHRRKQDAPSGTALFLAESAATARNQHLSDVIRNGREGRTGERPVGEIGVHAIRGGDVVGEHTVGLYGSGERIALSHVASSRATFAEGAVRAARWIAGRKAGTYTMADVLGLESPNRC